MRHAPAVFASAGLLATALLAGCAVTPSHARTGSDQSALQSVVDAPQREAANRARDSHRHPVETLAFFGVQPTDSVIEISPGGGWYSEILAPYLREGGTYIAAAAAAPADSGGGKRNAALQAKFAATPARYDRAAWREYDGKAPMLGPDASADVVLTFRNVHNWRAANQAEGQFRAFFAVLKPGGTLGVVEHRAKADVAADDKSGYVGQAQVIAMAEAAGFKLQQSSEINANPRDTRDHPNGVWTLLPGLRGGEEFRAIGESDRMTLKFRKPKG